MAQAVREQNWFAVVLEVCIVVVGVVVGFQVTAWGQARADRATEQVYLRQLAADLAETERLVEVRDERMADRTEDGLDRLLASFDAPQRPPSYSVAEWLGNTLYIASPRPILGTAEAMVASGDFGSVADDALRAQILRYLDVSREALADQDLAKEIAFGMSTRLFLEHVDSRILMGEAARSLPPAQAQAVRAAVPSLVPPGGWRPPFPLDVDALYDDPGFYRTLGRYAVVIGQLQRVRVTMRASAAALRQQVEAQIER